MIDGNGNSYNAIITSENKKAVSLKIIDHYFHKDESNKVHIAIAPTKSQDRLEWFVEKAVELGVSKITFLLTQRTERKKININRCMKISISAIKQSGRLYLPEIHSLLDFKSFINKSQEDELYICSLENNETKKSIYDIIKKNISRCFVIGPEGDFTLEEISLAKNSGYESISLGSNVLRTETAGVFVASACKMINKNG